MANLAFRWVFTLNHWTEDEYNKLVSLPYRYLVIGSETGASGTPHLQGYVHLIKRMRLSGLKPFAERAHWEVSRGTGPQASDYCKKDGVFEEFGDMPDETGTAGGAVEKERWVSAFAACKVGKLDDVPADILMRCYRTCKEIAKDYMCKPADADDVTGVWIYGPPGVGKSRKARADYPGAYDKMQNKWWDGYQGQDFVILDDFDSKEMGHLLKIWADRYSFLAETKGGAVNIRPKKFIVTSNYSPDEIVGWDDVLVAAIRRRFHVIHMQNPFGI